MKKLLALLPLVVIALAVAAGGALADHGDVAKPACADMSGADFGYSEFRTTATANIGTVTASCKSITYSIYVLDEATDATPSWSGSTRGDGDALLNSGQDIVTVTAAVSDEAGDNQVCMYATSSKGGSQGTNQLLDRFPNTGSVCLGPGEAGGTPFH